MKPEKGIPQSSNQGQIPRDTDPKLPQHQRETRIDLGVNEKVSALADL